MTYLTPGDVYQYNSDLRFVVSHDDHSMRYIIASPDIKRKFIYKIANTERRLSIYAAFETECKICHS